MAKDKKDRQGILREEVNRQRKTDFNKLSSWADTGSVISEEIEGYQVEIQALWDDKKKRHIRVIGFISDTKPKKWWNSFFTKNGYSFIVSDSGNFIDE